MDCEKLASQRKLKKEEIQENCFLGFEHFLRFRFAYSASKRTVKVKDYVVFLINEEIRTEDESVEERLIRLHELRRMNRRFALRRLILEEIPANCYVAGIDDSGKIFCTRLQRCPELYLESEIREIMGFHYHHYESFELSPDKTIRIQGDLLMDVLGIFDDEDKLIDFVLERISFPDSPTGELWENFMRQTLAKDEEVRKVEVLVDIYQEFEMLSIDMELAKLEKERKEALIELKLVEEEIKELAKKYCIPLEYIASRIDVIDFRRKFLARKALQYKDSFRNFVKESKRKLLLRLGHYTTPHEIRLEGITVLTRENLVEVAVLGGETLQLNHPEHGSYELYLGNKPMYLRFRLVGTPVSWTWPS